MRYPHHLWSEIKHWNRNIKLFFISNLLYQFGSGMFMVLYNLYIQALGFNQAMNGTLVSIQSLATALMFIPIGLAGDRISRKNILIIGALFTGLSFMGRSYVEGELGLQLFAVCSGLFASFYQVLAVPFLAANIDKSQRLHIFSYHFSMVLAAQVIGSIGGGIWADWMQGVGWDKVSSLQLVLMVGGAVSLASFVPLLFVKENKLVQPEPLLVEKQPSPLPSGLRQDEDWKRIIQFTLAQLLVGFGSGLVVPYLNLYFTDRFHVSLTAVGLLVSLGQVMTIFSILIGPSLAKRVGQVRAVVYFQLLSLPFLLLTGFTNLFVIASVSFLFRQALMNAANPIQSTLMVDLVSDRRRGIANSFTQTAFMLGWASMGTVQSSLITHYGSYWGYALTFCITGLLYVTAAVCFYFMFREAHMKRTSTTEASTP
ncbi:MFS transporter [Paenibacillus taiwanensis]|uniref:MFS transporter n=1 Tax=Paenibacillus taiwanensis TaxID=401638 RepID=UPI00041DA71A|nr:MFS transporter [Paenibacillus taiwanensis]